MFECNWSRRSVWPCAWWHLMPLSSILISFEFRPCVIISEPCCLFALFYFVCITLCVFFHTPFHHPSVCTGQSVFISAGCCVRCVFPLSFSLISSLFSCLLFQFWMFPGAKCLSDVVDISVCLQGWLSIYKYTRNFFIFAFSQCIKASVRRFHSWPDPYFISANWLLHRVLTFFIFHHTLTRSP